MIRGPLAGAAGSDVARFFTPEELEKWDAYRSVHLVFWAIATACTVLFFWSFLRGTPRLRASCERAAARLAPLAEKPGLRVLTKVARTLYGDPSWGAAALFAGAFFLLGRLALFPVQAVSSLWYERLHGLATYTIARWLRDQAIGAGVGFAGFAFIVIGLFGLVRRAPRRFWLALGIPCALVLAFSGFLDAWRPYLTLKHHDLEAGALRAKLQSLADGAGVTLKDMVVLQTSEVSSAADAYVAGLSEKRLFLTDTLLKKMPEDEIAVAVAHELGHARHPRWPRHALSAAALLAFLYGLSRLLRRAADRRWLGIAHPGDATAIGLVSFSAFVLFFGAGPIQAAVGRADELDADVEALTLTQDPGAYERLFVRIARLNWPRVEPSALERFWFFDHPSVAERLALAREWREGHSPAPATATPPGP